MLKKPLTRNQVDDLAEALVNVMRYSDPSVEYPNIEAARRDDGVVAEWFYPILNGANGFSELTAIHMYVTQETMFEEAGELLLGIGLTEMQHYSKLSDFVRKIGGKVDQRFNNSAVMVGETVQRALELAAASEQETINFYSRLQGRLLSLEETATVRIAQQLLAKLLADEAVHLRLLKERLDGAGGIYMQGSQGD